MTNYAKHHIDNTSEIPLLSGCERLERKEYKRRHDNVAKKVHWDLSIVRRIG